MSVSEDQIAYASQRSLTERGLDLHILVTDPAHKRRGAGSMLIRHMLEEAQRLGLAGYLESSEDGHSLYTGLGFKDVKLLEVDMSKWGAQDTHKTWAMSWKPRT